MGKTQQLGMYPNIGISSSGTPTTNYLPKFTGASTIGNSLIFDNGSNAVGVGTSSPISFGGAAKWITLEGSAYGGGLISSVSGVWKSAYYYDNTGYSFIYSGAGVGVQLWANESPALTIKSNGNVGIGTSSPTAIGNYRSLTLDGVDGSIIDIRLNGSANGRIFTASDAAVGLESLSTTLPLVFKTQNGSGSTERMRITSGGVICLNQTATQGAETLEISPKASGSIQYSIIINGNPSSYTYVSAMRFHNVGTAVVGSITFGTSSTSYNTTSDYRLKTDFKEFNGLSILDKIKMYDFEWTTDKSRMYGAIAHELNEVLPAAVVGEKDAVDEDGKIIPQGVDYSKIVPVLVNAIKELSAKVTALESQS